MKYMNNSKFPDYIFCSNGEIISTFWDRPMKPAKDKKGYLRTMLRDSQGNYHTIKVHREIAKAFIPNPHNKPQVNHINGDKTDNRVENLEWCTAKENSNHAVQNGLCKYAKLTPKKVREIRELMSTGRFYQREVAELYGVKRQTIGDIMSGRRWSHVL